MDVVHEIPNCTIPQDVFLEGHNNIITYVSAECS